MRYPATTAIVALIIGLITSNLLFAQSAPTRVRGIAGEQAPAWEVSKWHQLPDGKTTLDISDYKGKVLYLYFFQSWCPGCHSVGFPNLQKLHKKYKGDDAVEFVVLQSTFEGHRTNTEKKLEPTAKRYKLPIPFGHSGGRSGTPEIMRRYRTGGTPWVVIVDKNGRVQFNDHHIDPEKASSLIDQLKEK